MDITTTDLTKYNGGIIFYHIPVGKMPPHRIKVHVERLKASMQSITKYLEDQGFVMIFTPEQASYEAKWTIWGMDKPYLPDVYESNRVSDWVKEQQDNSTSFEPTKTLQDMLAQVEEAQKRKLSYKGD